MCRKRNHLPPLVVLQSAVAAKAAIRDSQRVNRFLMKTKEAEADRQAINRA
jgi:hypothetical protein